MAPTGPHIDAGGLRLDALDPSIARVAARYDVPLGMTASTRGRVADATAALWRQLSCGYRARGIAPGPTILPRHDPLTFGQQHLLTPFKDRIFSDERLKELRNIQFFVRAVGQLEPDHKVEFQMEHKSCQFFLRNVQRVELETQLPFVPFRDERWREATDLTFGPDQVLTYAPPDMSYTMSWEHLEDVRQSQRAILYDDEWELRAGRWRHDLGGVRPTDPRLGIVQRVKGRFATPEELLAEINEPREHKYKRLPNRLVEFYFYRRP